MKSLCAFLCDAQQIDFTTHKQTHELFIRKKTEIELKKRRKKSYNLFFSLDLLLLFHFIDPIFIYMKISSFRLIRQQLVFLNYLCKSCGVVYIFSLVLIETI